MSECTCGPSAPYSTHDWDCPMHPQNWGRTPVVDVDDAAVPLDPAYILALCLRRKSEGIYGPIKLSLDQQIALAKRAAQCSRPPGGGDA